VDIWQVVPSQTRILLRHPRQAIDGRRTRKRRKEKEKKERKKKKKKKNPTKERRKEMKEEF
jgi:hypothetical protein